MANILVSVIGNDVHAVANKVIISCSRGWPRGMEYRCGG